MYLKSPNHRLVLATAITSREHKTQSLKQVASYHFTSNSDHMIIFAYTRQVLLLFHNTIQTFMQALL